MPNHCIKVTERGMTFTTLQDILPDKNALKVLFITKFPTTECVEKGHYFQGSYGSSLWKRLKEYGILNAADGEYEDDHLIENGFGIVCISRHPSNYNHEPHPVEYLNGVDRVMRIINVYNPKILIFLYKSILERFLRYAYRIKYKPVYGFNEGLDEYFNAKVFVFPMPGTPCTASDIHEIMLELKNAIEQ